MRVSLRLMFLLFAFVAAYFIVSIGYRYLHEQMIVDDCLSGKHGSFDYSKMTCDLEENHPYISYHVRHPHDRRNLQTAFVFFASCTLAYVWLKVRSDKAQLPNK